MATYLIVCDSGNDRIVQRLASDLSYVGELAVDYPSGVCFDGTYLYVTLFMQDKIWKIRLSDLSFVLEGGGTGSGNGQLSAPMGISTDGTYLYVADEGNFRIQKFLCSDLSYVAKVGSYGSGDGQFEELQDLTTDGTHVYASDSVLDRIQKFLCSDLSFVSKIGSSGSGDDQFSWPLGIATNGTHLYVSDTGNYRIVKRLCSDLSFVAEYVEPSAPYEWGLCISLSLDTGFIYFTDDDYNQIVKTALDDYAFDSVVKIGSLGSGSDQFGLYGPDGIVVATEADPPAERPASFEESRDRLEGRGYISIFIDQLIEANKIFEIINEAVGSYLYSGYDGKYRYKVFEIERGEDSLQFTDDDIFSFTQSIDATEVFSNVRAEFAYRTLQDYPQVYLFEKKESQYLQNSPIPISMEKRLPFSERSDAIFWSQRALQMYGERQVLSRATVTAKGWPLEPGMFVQMTYTRQAINAVFEVLDVRRDLSTSKVDLVLGDQHGMLGGETSGGTTVDPGFWTEDAPVFPSALGGGAATPWNPAWSAEQKLWARQNMGFWCDENGFSDPTDADSRLPSTWV